MIKTISALSKYKNEATKTKATDKLSIKSIILPDVYESDDSTINFTKRIGGEIIQCYSLSEVKQKQLNNCVPSFKEIIFKPCRASSVTIEVFCEPSVLSFSTVKILDCDVSFTTRNTTMIANYDYETNQYLDPVADTYPLPLTLGLTNLEGSWWVKRNSEFLYSSDNLSPGDYGDIPGIYYDEEGDVFYLDLNLGGSSPVNTYEFKGKTNILELFIQSSGSSSPDYNGTVDVDFYETLRIKSFKFSLKDIVLSVPNYLPKGVTSLKEMFLGSHSLRGDLATWDTSRVTNMEGTFNGCDISLSDLSSWDVSKVTNMHSTFNNANLTSDLSSWDTSKVVVMDSLFMFCPLFNSNISNWNTSLVTSMEGMFWGASLFNQDISQWDVSKVTDMNYMFLDAYKFTGDISSWCVSNISTEPYNFYVEHPETVDFWPVSRRPQWGTCPERLPAPSL